ncbi:MAG: hypothetical protein KatS3mg131_3106 [Candidatus Tectimicrobiota bacterium]|nr:MAG: hypothetical protein KatS3mg131_3106 [Candidatus Tectomicrobia bacterium]
MSRRVGKEGPVRAARRLLIALLGGALLAAGAWAGEPRRSWLPADWLAEHAAQLGVEEETLATLRQLAAAARTREAELRQELHAAYSRLRQLLEQDDPDETEVLRQAEVIGALKLEKWKLRLRTLLRMRALLTPQQRRALVELWQRHEAAREEMPDAPPR